MNFRHEHKHWISLSDAALLRCRLPLLMRPDEHAGPTGRYLIRSLYFDTPEDAALQEKLDGVARREKFRIRFYNHDDSFIRLEQKSKHDQMTQKKSTPLTRAQCERILAGDNGWMRDDPHALIRDLHQDMECRRLQPKTLVDYTREAWIFPAGHVRVTLDSDIRTGIHSLALFRAGPAGPAVSSPGLVLLEVKYDGFLPDVIRHLIQLENRSRTGMSKYALCRAFG